MKRWILICDASEARIYQQDLPRQTLMVIRTIANPDGRAREQELVTDEPGRMRKSSGSTNLSAMDPRTTAHEAAAQRLAERLAEILDESALHHIYDQLIVAAPPHLLGLLRAQFTPAVAERLKTATAKDLIHIAATDLLKHLGMPG
jgi:protein required for attachment to host cells